MTCSFKVPVTPPASFIAAFSSGLASALRNFDPALVGTVYVPLSASEVPPAAHIFRCGFRSGKGPNCLANPQAFICKATPSQVPQVPPIQIPPSLTQNVHQGSERPRELLPLYLDEHSELKMEEFGSVAT